MDGNIINHALLAKFSDMYHSKWVVPARLDEVHVALLCRLFRETEFIFKLVPAIITKT